MELYTKEGKKIKVEITIWDILEAITYNEEFVDKMIKEDPPNYRYGLSFNEFLFLCLDIQNPKILNEDADAFKAFRYKYGKEVEYIEYINVLVERSIGYSLPDFEINPRLLELLNQNMNPNYTTEEKLIYYYFKLCFLLNIDTLYNFACLIFGELGSFNFKKAPNRLSEVNDVNNEVACFEFAAIFDKLIMMSGEYVVSWPYTGDRQHVNTEAIINRKLYRFDALEDPHGRNNAYRDLLNVKLNYGYDGIIVGGEDLVQGINSHLQYIDKIYKDVQDEFSWFLTQKKFSEDVMSECFSNIEGLDLDENIKQMLKKYFLKFDCVPLNGIEYCIEIVSSYKEIVEQETNFNIQLTGVGSTIDGYDFKLVLSVKNKNDDYIYFLFGKDSIEILSKKNVIELLEANSIIITQSKDMIENEKGHLDYRIKYRTIPGIDEEFQIRMNKQAIKTVLGPMLEETYNDSLNSGMDNKKLVKTTNE